MRSPLVMPFLAAALLAQTPQPDAFAALRFLMGRWQAAGSSGAPGQPARGEFTLAPDLDGRVLVRRNFAEYPAQGGRPAFRHDDTMTIFPEGGKLKALYVDNEGHVIHYEVSAQPGGGAVFVSTGGGPKFRLTYAPAGPDLVDLAFEIAPPGKDFATYLKAQVRRMK